MARAGTTGLRYGQLEDIAWYADNSGFFNIDATLLSGEILLESEAAEAPMRIAIALLSNGAQIKPVGIRGANPWGVFDMLGNVKEWVEDIFNPLGYEGLPTNGGANTSMGNRNLRMLRGCSYMAPKELCRAANRFPEIPNQIQGDQGFRIVARPKATIASSKSKRS